MGDETVALDKALTQAERAALKRALGVAWPAPHTITCPHRAGAASWYRMMRRLVDKGLFRPSPWSGYELTDEGRAIAETL